MIFLDNASTTKPDDEIVQNFVEYQKYFYNPGALYKESVQIGQKIEEVRAKIVKLLKGSSGGNFIFTSTSTEANNIIVNSVISNNKNEEYLFSSLEHPSVFNLAKKLQQSGKKIVFIPTKSNGEIDEEFLLENVNQNTKFVSILNVSNETGAICNVNDLTKKIKQKNPKTLVHSDGVQALGKIEVDVSNLDFYTISSHKIYGLKGIAGFYVKNISLLKPLILGGGQEFDVRAGTTNAPMIFAFYDTILRAISGQKENYLKVFALNELLRKKLMEIDRIVINSPSNPEDCSPYILSFSVLGLNAETIMNMLSSRNICVGLGSACSSKKSGNRALESMHKNKEEILGNLRVSLGKHTTEKEIVEFCEVLALCVNTLREKL